MTFTFLSWNVEHFDDDPGRTKVVADRIKAAHPAGKPIDVMGILEVKNIRVRDLMLDHFPNYDFYLTDGPQVQEILIGVRRGVFVQKIFTQKREFKAGNESLRPGALISLLETTGGEWTQLLYLHTDSGTTADDFGNRFNMFSHVAKMRKALAKQASVEDRLIALGDLNTMGLNYPKKNKIKIAGSEEIAELAYFTNLTLATKDVPATWRDANKKIKDSDLDHVLHSPGLQLTMLGKRPNGDPTAIHTGGWPKLTGADQSTFIRTISDHAILVGETLN
jgi:Endonuclease/Exonuclease/phosphatase family